MHACVCRSPLCMHRTYATYIDMHIHIFNNNMHTLYIFFTTIYHQDLFHSVRRNPSLNCLHRRRSLAILGHEGPRWWIRLSLHLVLGLPCRLFHSRGVHSVTLFVHLLSVIIVQGLCHTRHARQCGLARYFLLGFLPLAFS